jgi:hypothetical protein
MTHYERYRIIKGPHVMFPIFQNVFCNLRAKSTHVVQTRCASCLALPKLSCHPKRTNHIQIKFAWHMHVSPLPFFIGQNPLPSIRPLLFIKFEISHMLCKPLSNSLHKSCMLVTHVLHSSYTLHMFYTAVSCYTSSIFCYTNTEGFYVVSKNYPARLYTCNLELAYYIDESV